MLEICDYIKMVLDEFAAKLRNAAVALVWDIMFQKLMQEEHWMNYFRCYFVIEMNESIQ